MSIILWGPIATAADLFWSPGKSTCGNFTGVIYKTHQCKPIAFTLPCSPISCYKLTCVANTSKFVTANKNWMECIHIVVSLVYTHAYIVVCLVYMLKYMLMCAKEVVQTSWSIAQTSKVNDWHCAMMHQVDLWAGSFVSQNSLLLSSTKDWLQLYFLDLASNALEGTLPHSWSKLSQVSRQLLCTA